MGLLVPQILHLKEMLAVIVVVVVAAAAPAASELYGKFHLINRFILSDSMNQRAVLRMKAPLVIAVVLMRTVKVSLKRYTKLSHQTI